MNNYHFVQFLGIGLPKLYFTKFVDKWIKNHKYLSWTPYCSDGSKISFDTITDFKTFITDLKSCIKSYDVEFKFNIRSTLFRNESCISLNNYELVC